MNHDLVAFDVNETLLDVSALRPAFRRVVGPGIGVGEWFARMLHRSLLANELGRYQSFGDLGVEALLWLAAREEVRLTAEEAASVVDGLAGLPAHPDVMPGLEALSAAGTRMIALTNGSAEMAEAQIASAGLDTYFERVLSVEAVRRFKPAPEAYAYAADTCGVDIGRMVMVAAHDWDVAGAQVAGAVGCFVRRQPWGLAQMSPNLSVDDMGGLAAALEV